MPKVNDFKDLSGFTKYCEQNSSHTNLTEIKL